MIKAILHIGGIFNLSENFVTLYYLYDSWKKYCYLQEYHCWTIGD